MASTIVALSADERLARIGVKIERAKQHFGEPNAKISAFHDTKPYEFTVKRNPQSRKLIYYMSKVDPIPTEIAAIAGDVIQNLRSALDHLIVALFMFNNPGVPVPNRIAFPTDSSSAQFKTSFGVKVQGLRQDAIDAICNIEPYDGGRGAEFSRLNKLNRIDKHRLMVTVAAQFRDIDLGPVMESLHNAAFPGMQIPQLSLRVRPADRLFAVKVGDELYSSGPDHEVNENLNPAFEIAINEPGIAECQPLVETLNHWGQLVADTILGFKSCLN